MNASRKLSSILPVFLLAILTFGFSARQVQAQFSQVDPTFNPIFSKDINGGTFALQPDGKIIVFGGFQVVNGTLKNQIARLNRDGSLDNTFDCTAACDFNIGSVQVQPDGKILVAGSFYYAATQTSAARIKRLNADGSLDTSFNSTFNSGPIPTGNSGVTVSLIQPDGKILILYGGYNGGYSQVSLYRLNADGSNDTTFTPYGFVGGRTLFDSVGKIVLLPDGKILVATYIATYGTGSGFYRFNSNGARDTSFENPTLSGTAGAFGNGYRIFDIEVLGDGSLLLVGDFNAVNGISRTNIVKILPAGNVDLNFAPPNAFQSREPASGVDLFSNGKILVSTGIMFNPVGPSGTTNRFIAYNADGSLDSSFVSPPNLQTIAQFEIESGDTVLVNGTFTENGTAVRKFARLNPNGTINSFLNLTFGGASSITALGVQPDNKILVAGDYTYLGGATRKNLVRLNADGTFDPTFSFNVSITNPITKILVQPDGKILLVGSFAVNQTSGYDFIRLNADGSFDRTFDVFYVSAVALQADVKIVVGGSYTNNGQSQSGVVRLNQDGTLDASFNPQFAAGSTFVRLIETILVQADGKIVVGGSFSAVNGFARRNLVRLNADGSLDTSFNAGTEISAITQIVQVPDGKYAVPGTGKIIRLNNNGTEDATFRSPDLSGTVNILSAQSDGTIIVAGNFSVTNNPARSNLIRLRPSGAVDNNFLPSGANNQVRSLVRQTDGRIVIGGDFTVVGGVTRLGVARLNVTAYRPITPFDFDGDGRADVSLFRPASGNWYILPSQTGGFYGFPFGQAGDLIAPADYDGDGKTDVAVFRPVVAGAGDQAYFYILNSADNSFRAVGFGTNGDAPFSGDWDGDGKADLAVYRAATVSGGQSNFYYRPSSQPSVNFYTLPLGTLGDKPVPADYDGDGRIDPAIFRVSNPSVATWYILQSSVNQISTTSFALPTDIPTPADFDGDGKANIAVFRPSNGTWYTSQSAASNYGAIVFGANGDVPVAADYDGDGRADAAVFRPSNGSWFLNRSTSGLAGVQFGANGDKPSPNAYIR